MLELITGRKAIDTTKPNNEQNLVTWVCFAFQFVLWLFHGNLRSSFKYPLSFGLY